MADAPKVLNMWSGPRNCSTALMYSWRQRPDTTVYDEPFYGVYLKQFDPGHPGRDEVLADMELDVEQICRAIEGPGERPVRYIKNIAHHFDALDESILDRWPNLLLVRHPAEVIASLSATLGDDYSADITGMSGLGRILDHEVAAGRDPLVFETRKLLLNPEETLQAMCIRAGVEWTSAMLQWPAGPKPEDGAWAKYWYHSTHASTGFGEYRPKTEPLNTKQQALLEQVLPIWEKIESYIV